VPAELCRRDLVPAIWLPDPSVREERERARFRLHLVRHRTALGNRIHQTLVAFGVPCPVADLFGSAGRQLLERLRLPEPWRETVVLTLAFVDDLDRQIDACERELRRLGADHAYVPLLMTIPGIGWVLRYTIAAEIGDIARFASPTKLAGYSGLCPRVYQSGSQDRRGPLAKNGPKYLRSRAHRGRPARRPLAPLSRALPAHQEAPRQEPRRQGGRDRGRPPPVRGDLVDAQKGVSCGLRGSLIA